MITFTNLAEHENENLTMATHDFYTIKRGEKRYVLTFECLKMF